MASKIKNLHVCGLDKFIPPFIEFIRKELPETNNFFYTIGEENLFSYEAGEDSYHQQGRFLGYIKLLGFMYAAEKIILHGLFNPRIIIILALNPWLLKKCYWVIWGGDLYACKLSEKNFKWKFKEALRKHVIKKIGHLVTYIEGDVKLAREWYGATGKYHECIMYLSNVFQGQELPGLPKDDTINIQVGNSADPSNNHLEVLEKLLPYKDKKIVIYTPLSYGDEEYAQCLIRNGKEMFGDKFRPMIDFLPFKEYLDFLSKIDIAVFNHERQQAMGNTITLLGMGKMVFVRSDTTQWQHFQEKNIHVRDVKEVNLQVHEDECERNKVNVKKIYNKENLRGQWEVLLNE